MQQLNTVSDNTRKAEVEIGVPLGRRFCVKVELLFTGTEPLLLLAAKGRDIVRCCSSLANFSIRVNWLLILLNGHLAGIKGIDILVAKISLIIVRLAKWLVHKRTGKNTELP